VSEQVSKPSVNLKNVKHLSLSTETQNTSSVVKNFMSIMISRLMCVIEVIEKSYDTLGVLPKVSTDKQYCDKRMIWCRVIGPCCM